MLTMKTATPERISPVEAARRVFAERYAEARVLFLAGSVIRGEATATSDLDVVVVYERLAHAWRESFSCGGWPVEAFVHDPETWEHFVEIDRRRGVPALLRMVIEGVEVPAASEFSAGGEGRGGGGFEGGGRGGGGGEE